jgi:hypothetical protein
MLLGRGSIVVLEEGVAGVESTIRRKKRSVSKELGRIVSESVCVERQECDT